MDIYEPLPVLLSFEKQENTIILRLDANGLGSFIKGEKAVQEITIKGCDLSADIIEEFEKYVNQVFEHEVFQQGNKLIFQLWADYGRLENEFECDDISKSFSEYTTEDLLQKGSILYNLYVDLHKKFTDNEGINYQLRKKLTFNPNSSRGCFLPLKVLLNSTGLLMMVTMLFTIDFSAPKK